MQKTTIKCDFCKSGLSDNVAYDLKYIKNGILKEEMFCSLCYHMIQYEHGDIHSNIEIVMVQEYRSLDSDSTTTSTH